MARDRIFERRRRRRGAMLWLFLFILAPVLLTLRPLFGTRESAAAVQIVRDVQYDARPVASPPSLSAQSAILMDADTGVILSEKNAHVRRPMASTTKMMTAILVLEHCRLDDIVTASEHASKTPYTGLYLKPGEKISVRDLLWAIMLRSANDACVAAGEHVAGSEEAFVAMMNAKAEELGLKDTQFKNPHGLHAEGHYSSAYDLAQIARYGMQIPFFAEMAGRKAKRIERSIEKQDVVVVNKNRLVFRWDAADGVKTGYTRQAGHCLAASASKDGWRLISIVLKSGDSWTESRQLLEYGFANYQRVVVAKKGTPLAEARVLRGRQDKVAALLARDLGVVTPRGAGVDVKTLITPGKVRAPLVLGDSVGLVVLRRGELELARSPLVAATAVEERPRVSARGVFLAGLGGLSTLFVLAAGARYGRKIAQGPGRRRRRVPPRF